MSIIDIDATVLYYYYYCFSHCVLPNSGGGTNTGIIILEEKSLGFHSYTVRVKIICLRFIDRRSQRTPYIIIGNNNNNVINKRLYVIQNTNTLHTCIMASLKSEFQCDVNVLFIYYQFFSFKSIIITHYGYKL